MRSSEIFSNRNSSSRSRRRERARKISPVLILRDIASRRKALAQRPLQTKVTQLQVSVPVPVMVMPLLLGPEAVTVTGAGVAFTQVAIP